MKKLVEISNCSKCPRNYFNTMPSDNIKDGKTWCGLSNKQLDANKMFTEIPEWCELPTSEGCVTVTAETIVHDPNSRPIHFGTGMPVVAEIPKTGPSQLDYDPFNHWMR